MVTITCQPCMMVTMEPDVERDRRAGYAGDMQARLPVIEEDLGRAPAPGSLEIVRRFINSREVDPVREELSSPSALRAWIRAHGLPGGEGALSDEDLRRAIELREALRSLAFANNGEELEPDAVDEANEVAAGARLVLRFDERGGAHLVPDEEGIGAALGALMAIVAAAMADGTWSRIKACRSHTCEWAFYDRSKNRSSTWCSMAACGSREKSREYRRRRARASAPGSSG
jgi:predicted RNA-binding Zn ribbon-like protein